MHFCHATGNSPVVNALVLINVFMRTLYISLPVDREIVSAFRHAIPLTLLVGGDRIELPTFSM